MKSILVATEQFTVGGLETHIRGELRSLSRSGHRMHLVTGERFSDRLVPPGVESIHHVRFSADGTIGDWLSTVDRLRRLIRDQGIELVHVHPFSSVVPACVAAALEKVPCVLTIHGPASLSDYGALDRILIQSMILPSVAHVIAVSEEVAGLVEPYTRKERLSVLPNGVDFERSGKETTVGDGGGRWLLVSRLDDAKIEGIIDFIAKAQDCALPGISIAGDGPARGKLVEWLESTGGSSYVEMLGEKENIRQLMNSSLGVAGMGRVVLEAIAARKPVVLVGYDGVKGYVTQELFVSAAKSNFSGRGLPTLSSEAFCRSRLSAEVPQALFEMARREYDEAFLWQRFAEVVGELENTDEGRLCALYRSLEMLDETARRQSFQASETVVAKLIELATSDRYFDPRLVAALCDFRQTRLTTEIRSLQTLQGERIGALTQALETARAEVAQKGLEIERLTVEVDRLNRAMQSQSDYLQALSRENERMKRSLSWRITWPARVVGYFFRDPGGVLYTGAKTAFWALPPGLRQFLHGPRHRIVRWMRGSAWMQAATADTAKKRKSDLDWETFRERMLAVPSQYEGVFVQVSTIPWNTPLFQRPQHMASALADLGYLVVFITPVPGGDDVDGYRQVRKNVWITNRRDIEQWEGTVWSVYSTDSMTDMAALEKRRQSVLVYEYIDHIDPQISGDAANIERLERLKAYAFSGGADLIVSSAQALHEEALAAVGEERCVLVPNGVDVAHYRNVASDTMALPEKVTVFRARYSRLVGYFGALAPWLWYDTIAELARLRPDVGFLFIGPDYYGGADRLPSTDNVLYLGPVEYQRLPAYGRLFDVCFIPFAPGDVAKTTSPLKLFEYFAMEKPVVSTSFMSECIAFSEVFHGDSASSLSDAIDNALAAADDPEYRAALRRLADENSWEQRAKALSEALQKRFSGR